MEAPSLTSWHIVALDPSTDWTGAVFLEYREDGVCRVLRFAAVSGDWSLFGSSILEPHGKDLFHLVGRIARTGVWLSRELTHWADSDCFDVVAFEDVRKFTGSRRGALTSEAMIGATFHYLALPRLRGLPVIPILRVSSCSAVGAAGVYRQPAGKSKAEQEAKRARLKAAVQEGVIRQLDLVLHEDAYSPEEIEAICDAAAVGLAAGKKLVEELKLERAKAAQKSLRLGGSRGPAKRAKAA